MSLLIVTNYQKMIIVLILESALRLFGIFWMVGGLFALKTARDSQFIDDCLEQLEQKNISRLSTNFGFLLAILTFVSGLFLLLNKNEGVIILLILIITQLVYFKIKKEKLKTAQTPEDIEEYTINPSTYNAFRTSVYVTIIVVIKTMLQSILS